MYDIDIDKCFHDIKKAVVKAGTIAKRNADTAKIKYYKDQDDVVTETDLLIEDIIHSYIKKKYPSHGFSSEEKGDSPRKTDYTWILDPIDGTKYYANGFPLYSISLALEYKGDIVLGIVYLPETGQLLSANSYKDHGAFLNQHSIHCSDETELKNIDVCLEIPNHHVPAEKLKQALDTFTLIISHVRRVRIIGVGSIGLCFCASGSFGLYINLGSNYSYCDYAAGKVIIEQAGGEFRKFTDTTIAGNRVLVQKAVDIFNFR